MNEAPAPPNRPSRVDTILALIDRTLEEYDAELAASPGPRPAPVPLAA